MDVTDYSAKLANARSDFADKSDKLHTTFKENETDLEELHENDKKHQKDVYMKERQEMKDTFSKLTNDQDDIAKNKIQQETKRYIEKGEEQLHDFNLDRQNTKRNYDKKLTNIKRSFDNTLKERSLSFDNDVANSQKMYEERAGAAEKDKNDTLRKMNLSSSKNLADIRDESEREKFTMQQRNESVNQKLIKEGQADASNKRDIQNEQINNIKFNNEQNLGMLKKHQSEQVQQINNQKKTDAQKMRNNFENLTDKLSDKFNADNELARRETKQLIVNKDRDQARSMQALRNETKAKVTGGSRLDNQIENEKRLVDGYENRMKHIKNKLEEVKYKNQEDKNRMNKKNQSQIAAIELKNNKNIESKNKDMRDYREKVVKSSKQEMQDTIDTYKQELRSTKQEQIQQGMNSAEKSKQLLNNQRMDYSRNMIEIQQKNEDLLVDLQDKNRRENSAFIENTRKKTHHERQELKHDLRQTFSRKEDSLNKRLDSSLKKNFAITSHYENKLENIKNKSAEEIQDIRMLSDERRSADRRTFRREFENINKQKQLELSKLKGDFERKIAKTKRDNDKSSTKLIRSYETQLSTERKEHHRTMAKKLEVARTDYERLYSQSELEKATLKNQFEIQMANLRQTFQDQAEQATHERAEKMSKA
jgi:hypothetical protein